MLIGCGNEVERRGGQPAIETESSARSTRPTIADLVAFRDAAAAAPYWQTVDWTPPTTLAQVATETQGVVIGAITGAQVVDPRADPFSPYEGSPTLFHLEVAFDVTVARTVTGASPGPVVQGRLPVLTSGLDGLSIGDDAAERIASAAPVGATAVFTLQDCRGFTLGGGLQCGGDSPVRTEIVALESSTGELVAFLQSMDPAVRPLTVASLAESLADLFAGR